MGHVLRIRRRGVIQLPEKPMSLQEKLAALKTEFETKMAPPAVVEVLHRVTDELIASGQAERALRVGDRAPSFTLPDPNGKPVSSADLLAKGPLVVTFYRGAWCPFCSLDLQALEEARSEIEARGATLVAISPQTAPNSRKTQRANKLGFPILGDQGGELAARFGIRWKLPEDLQQVHKQLGADLPAFNGDGSWTLPMPARYVIGRDGIIAYAEINPDYTSRPEPSDIYPVLDRLRSYTILQGARADFDRQPPTSPANLSSELGLDRVWATD
jgi:peroxiredoxin